MKEITDGLQALIARDFHFTHPRSADGSLIAVVGIRAHHDVIPGAGPRSSPDAFGMTRRPVLIMRIHY